MAKILIVRGDLASHSGYSKALRAITAMMAPGFDLVAGVDPHYSPRRSTAGFPYHRISDAQAAELIGRAAPGQAVVLHLTTPDGFCPLPGAYHIGYFFWETDRFRPDLMWPQAIQAMHEMWVPNRFTERLVRAGGFTGPVSLVTWPHDLDGGAASVADPGPMVDLLGASRPCRLSHLRDGYDTIFLGISTDVPRKGLPILLAEWMEHLRRGATRSLLLLKLSTINVTKANEALRTDVLNMLESLRAPEIDNPRIGLILEFLSDDELGGLYSASDALVTATMGEGFGGPVVECLRYGRPFLSPRHTALEELIAPDYPFIVPTEPALVILRDNVPVYSLASQWNIVERGGLCEALRRFEETPAAERAQIAEQARQYALRFCGKDAVAQALERSVAQLRGRLQALQ